MHTLILGIACLPLAVGGDTPPGPVEIAWRWSAAENLRYEFTRSTREVTPTPSRDFVQTREITRIVSHDALPAANIARETNAVDTSERPGPAVPVRLRWEAVRFVNDSNFGHRVEYDSRIEHHWTRTAQPGIGRIAAVVGQSVEFALRPDGSAAGITGLEAMIHGMESRMIRWGIWNESTPFELDSTYTPEMMKETTEHLYQFLPERPVRPGETHEVRRILLLPQVGLIRANETHELTGIAVEDARLIASFEVSGQADWPEPTPEIAERFTVAVNSSTITGAWRFDVDAGRLIDYEVRVEFMADIIRYDPSTRTGTEIPTKQIAVDRTTLLTDHQEHDERAIPCHSE